ncbi:hypothetical protein N658DRAFT_104386 [Parathielavia hyrcaniae]|uniref:Uncharacterized protein n=1 Tax=Parathielavia hyrcaniae TaxID=113614 RepID=A0AAN6T053_9PEZI|nr:hypothetical protein N658DRAFT_104386 [Parathielavia hyrcaniae]
MFAVCLGTVAEEHHRRYPQPPRCYLGPWKIQTTATAVTWQPNQGMKLQHIEQSSVRRLCRINTPCVNARMPNELTIPEKVAVPPLGNLDLRLQTPSRTIGCEQIVGKAGQAAACIQLTPRYRLSRRHEPIESPPNCSQGMVTPNWGSTGDWEGGASSLPHLVSIHFPRLHQTHHAE